MAVVLPNRWPCDFVIIVGKGVSELTHQSCSGKGCIDWPEQEAAWSGEKTQSTANGVDGLAQWVANDDVGGTGWVGRDVLQHILTTDQSWVVV